jgi:hypothetical protein
LSSGFDRSFSRAASASRTGSVVILVLVEAPMPAAAGWPADAVPEAGRPADAVPAPAGWPADAVPEPAGWPADAVPEAGWPAELRGYEVTVDSLLSVDAIFTVMSNPSSAWMNQPLATRPSPAARGDAVLGDASR